MNGYEIAAAAWGGIFVGCCVYIGYWVVRWARTDWKGE